MSFLAAVPLIGQALDSTFSGLDKLFTSDDERLKGKYAILMAFQPVITLLVQSQAEFDRMRAEVDIAAMKSEDRFIRWSRPAMSWITFIGWQYAMFISSPHADQAFYAFGLVAGLWSASRGGEKIISQWMGKNGNSK